MTTVLWISLALLAAASFIPAAYNFRLALGGFGWLLLSLHWFSLAGNYSGINDYYNVFIVVAAGILCLFVAYLMLYGKGSPKKDALISLSCAASIAGVIYFMFLDIGFLNTWLISLVTSQVIWVLGNIGLPVTSLSWNQVAVNGFAVEIILACTAIESMALFLGLITSAAGVPLSRRFRAFMVSVPVIYILNLLRVSFTASAYGFSWFGTPEESFHISEHFITKIGSTIALLWISYMVLKILPEVADVIDGIVRMMKFELQKIVDLKK